MGSTHEYSPIQPAEEAQQKSSSSAHDCRVFLVLSMLVMLVFAITSAVAFLVTQIFGQVPHFSVAIDHISGLDPTTDLSHKPLLEPEFNLTLRVASRGLWATECTEPRMYMIMSYRGVALAATATLMQKICAGPSEAVEHHLIARGVGVVVPGSLLDSLEMDMRIEVPEFDVELRGPGPRKIRWACGPRLVGDACSLDRECTL